MEISAQLVKQLRDKTGAGMMDCKRALVEARGDLGAAEEFLRKKGLMDAVKKSARVAADGLVAVCVAADRRSASVVEVNSETDFVARNEKFQALVAGIAEVALGSGGSADEVRTLKFPQSGGSVEEEVSSLISIIGENISLRRVEKLGVANGVVASYVHNSTNPSMGKIGVLLALEAEGQFDAAQLEAFGKKLAMHIVAANPTYLDQKSVPQNVIDKEREIVLAQAKEIGKPADIAEKMAQGRIKKFFEESVLFEQLFVMDGKTKVHDVIDAFGKENATKLTASKFVKFVLGEGIEKKEANFAEEVQSFIK